MSAGGPWCVHWPALHRAFGVAPHSATSLRPWHGVVAVVRQVAGPSLFRRHTLAPAQSAWLSQVRSALTVTRGCQSQVALDCVFVQHADKTIDVPGGRSARQNRS